MSTDLTETPAEPMALIHLALQKGMDVDKLERLFALQERWETNRAAEAWAEAVRRFQDQMKTVHKRKDVADRNGKKLYSYADYDDDILAVAQPILRDCGITVTFTTRTELVNNKPVMTTICHVRVGTHVEDTEIALGLPDIPNANDAQKAGGAMAYGQRYSFAAALNLRISGRDNDATLLVGTLDDKQLDQLKNALDGRDLKRFLVWASDTCKAEIVSIEKFPAAFFDQAIAQLKKPRTGGQS